MPCVCLRKGYLSSMSTPLSVERIRDALVSCALAAYDDALVRGLCAEGAREAAIGAMRSLDLSEMPGWGTSQTTTRLPDELAQALHEVMGEKLTSSGLRCSSETRPKP